MNLSKALRISAAYASLAFAISGCATPTSLREDGPKLNEITMLTARQAAGCIGDKLQAWSQSSQFIMSTRPTQTGYSISAVQTMPGLWSAGGTDTVILIDIDSLKEKTRVRLYTHFLTGGEVVTNMVRSCL